MAYFQLPADIVYSILGIDPSGSDDVILPQGVAETDFNKQIFYDTLTARLDDVESAAERVLDSMHEVAKRSLKDFLVEMGVDLDQHDYEWWHKSIPDDLAWETFFGLMGGAPEYNELADNYIPDMLSDTGIAKDVEDVLLLLLSPVEENGDDQWENIVEPTVRDAFAEAEKTVKHYSAEGVKKRLNEGVVLVDYDGLFVVYDEGHKVEEFDDILSAEKFVDSLVTNWDFKFYYDPTSSSATTWDDDHTVQVDWRPVSKSDPPSN